MKIAVVRGKFLNRYEMQFFEPLAKKHDLTAFGSLKPYHENFAFPVIKLPCPMDLPDFPMKMPFLNRLFTDAHVLLGLEDKLSGFDIVHTAETYYRYTYQAIRARKLGRVKKVVATVLENIPFNNESINGRKELKEYTINNLNRIIALTQRTRAALELEGADPEKISVLGHFIDTDRFCPPVAWPACHGVNKKNFRLFFAGRLETYKGIFELLYAFKLIINQLVGGKTLTLVYAGNGSQTARLRNRVRRLGLGKMVAITESSYDKMPDLYREADIYLAPSKETSTWQEQYNTTLLEAQASGLPIITTASGGISENVGTAAILVQPGDVVSLRDAIYDLLTHHRKRQLYAKKARDRAVMVHDARLGAARLEEIYKQTLLSHD
jgi:glycosyltransferase involved in cell wall biosynthesis